MWRKWFLKEKSIFTPRRVKTRTLIQMELTECGAVCLSMILGYYGKFIPIEELRVACNINRDGSNAENISIAAESYSLSCEGYSLDIEDLNEVPLPAIIHWNLEHFVVLEGFGSDFIYINDPSTGPRTVTVKEFDESFSGVVLCFDKTEAFVPSGAPPSFWEPLYERIHLIKSPFIYATIASLCLIIPGLALPAASQVFVDQIIINKNFDWGLGIALSLLIIFMFEWVLSWLERKVLLQSYVKMSIITSSKSLWHMLRLPYSFYTQRLPGEIAYRLNANDQICETISTQLVPIGINAFLIVFYALAMLYYDLIIALVAFATIILNFVVLQRLYRSKNDAYARFQADSGKATSFGLGIIENIENIKEMGMEYKCFPTWAGYYTKTLNATVSIGKKDVILGTLPGVFEILAVLAVVGLGGWSVINGSITIGMLIAIQILMRSILRPLMNLVNLAANFQFLKVDMGRLSDILKCEIDPQFQNLQDESMQLKNKLQGSLEMDNVSFSYGNVNEAVLKNIHLSVSPGKSIALVGKTGSGKSTVAKLISRLYEPINGTILLDNMPMNDIPNMTLRSSLSVVEQKPFLFRGTAKDNLTMLDNTIELLDVIQAAKDACIHEMIIGRKGGYDFLVEQDGINLSGGEKQCFEIARALVRNPSLIVFDEATSSLDSEVEFEIIKHVRRRGIALVMIAHRLSTIKTCDEIIVLDQGQIIAKGTHDELVESCKPYLKMIQSETE